MSAAMLRAEWTMCGCLRWVVWPTVSMQHCELSALVCPQGGDLATVFENIRPRARQAGMDGSKEQLYTFFVQVSSVAQSSESQMFK